MAMLSSYTLLSRVPAPGPKFSPTAATATPQLRCKQLPPPEVVSALRWASCKESRRAPLFVCHAQGDKKYEYDIQPSALQNAPKSASAGKDWNVMGDEDLVILKLRLGELDKSKVKIGTTTGQTHLVIQYRNGINEETEASKLDVSLALPQGSKVQPRWFYGWLVILIAKPKPGSEKIETKQQIAEEIDILS